MSTPPINVEGVVVTSSVEGTVVSDAVTGDDVMDKPIIFLDNLDYVKLSLGGSVAERRLSSVLRIREVVDTYASRWLTS
jgi:hypothetical protein